MSPGGRDLFRPRAGLTLPLCGLHFVFFFLAAADPAKTLAIFGFEPSRALVAPWSFVTYQFLHTGPLSLFFGALGLWFLGSALEEEWGTREYLVFWLVATLGGSLSAWALGARLTSDPYVVPVSMLFAFAVTWPDVQFLVFFVVPVKVKWLAWITAALLVFGFATDLAMGLGTALVRVIGAASGFLWFLARREGKSRARRAVFHAATVVKAVGTLRQDGALEKRNRELFPRVEELRNAVRLAQGGELAEGQRTFRSQVERLVVSGVNVCKPVDFKGDRDGVCLKCEGFAECSLRYVGGEPDEIVVRNREG